MKISASRGRKRLFRRDGLAGLVAAALQLSVSQPCLAETRTVSSPTVDAGASAKTQTGGASGGSAGAGASSGSDYKRDSQFNTWSR